MKMHIANAIVICLLLAGSAWSQDGGAETGVPVSVVVSAQAKHGTAMPVIYPEDVRVFHDGQRMKVTEWLPLQGEHAGLELFLLVDDALDSSIGLQYRDLENFIYAQPPTTEIALGYIRFGSVQVVQNMTKDRRSVVKALRLPMGSGTMSSPYNALTDLIQDWPESGNRRHIFMISSGVDALQPGPINIYLDNAIEQAQRSGIQIYSIYASRIGYAADALSAVSWGQNNLLQLADETGGDTYLQGLQTPLSFAPYLEQFAERLQHQYRLTFLAQAGKKGRLETIRLQTEVPHVKLLAAERVYVPGM
ncbi:MAG: hypothetical protein ACM3SW_09225 [Actinomycetota bacterium]